jgi:hypothetical protein
MKNIIKNWLEKLESANKSTFGSEPLDCCTVGRDKKVSKPINTTNKRNQ